MQPVKGLGLQASQYFSICPLSLTIASWVSDGSKTDSAAEVLDILHEGAACELCAVVVDDPVGYTKMAHYSLEELDGRLSCDLPHCLHLRPLCELVDCNVQVLEAPDSAGERAQYVEPPYREGPGERDGLKGLGWLMELL